MISIIILDDRKARSGEFQMQGPGTLETRRGRKLMEDFTEPNNLKICMKVWEPSFSCTILLVSGSVAPVEEEEER